MKLWKSLLLSLFFLLLSAFAAADSWVTPRPCIFASDYNDRAFKIIPHDDKAKGTLLWLDDDGNLLPVWETMLVNIPLAARISGRGVVITLDTYYTAGHDHIVVIYGPKGEVRADYKLTDLFNADERKRMKGSMSGIYWREDREIKIAFVGRKEVLIMRPLRAKIGREMRFDLETGKVFYCPNPYDQPLRAKTPAQ